jgi:aryl-alcohol dehydrogenase-like predicted oxidoreductase
MEFRRLGRSGLKVSEISYGNWLTHGSQVEAEQATACVHEALEVGITTFDTADVYAQTKAETVLGEALKGQRREGLEIFTKVYWPTGPGPERPRAVAQAHHRVAARLAAPAADRLRRPLPGAPLRLRDAARGDAQGLRRPGAPGQGALRRRQRVEGLRDRGGAEDRRRHGLRPPGEQPAAVLDAVAVIEGEVVPLCAREGVSQIVWSPIAQGVLTGKYLPGQAPPEGSRATDATGAGFIKGFLRDEVLEKVQQLKPLADEAGCRWRRSPSRGCCRTRTSPARSSGDEPEQVRDNVAAAGVPLDPELLRKVDDVLEGVVVSDPAKTVSPAQRP